MDSPLEQTLLVAGEAEDRQSVAAAGRYLLAWEQSCGLAQGSLGVPSGVAEAWRNPGESKKSDLRGSFQKKICLISCGSKPK